MSRNIPPADLHRARPGNPPERQPHAHSPPPRVGNVHPRSPSPDEDEPDNQRARLDEWTAQKKKYADPYGLVARKITRTMDMLWEPGEVIAAGVELDSFDTADEMNARVREAQGWKDTTKYAILHELLSNLPNFTEKIRSGEDGWQEAKERLERGKTSAKTEDNHVFKRWISSFYHWTPAVGPLKKSERGVGHEQLAKWLRPVTVKWGDQAERRKFLVEHDPPMTARPFPALIYDNANVDHDNLEEGMFKSEQLAQAGRVTLYPPTVANIQDPNNVKSNRQSKAQKYNLDNTVTPAFIAYVCVAFRYTISAEETFMETSGTFNYAMFYNDIIDWFESPEYEDQSQGVIEWWNERVFPQDPGNRKNGPSMLEMLRQQANRN